MLAVRLPDGSTQHFNLRQQPYKVTQDQPSTRDGGVRPLRRGSEPPGSQGPGAQQQLEPGSGPGHSNGKRLKQQTSPNSNSTGGSGSARAAAVGAAAAAGRERKQPGAAAADTRADGTSKPPRRAAADRAAAVAVAVSMGGNGGMQHGRDADAGGEKSSRRPAPTPKAGTAGGAFSGGGGGTKRPADVGWDAGRKLPPLNMSHVSKKDREAARMLLTFSSPTGQEVSQPGRQGGAAADAASLGGDCMQVPGRHCQLAQPAGQHKQEHLMCPGIHHTMTMLCWGCFAAPYVQAQGVAQPLNESGRTGSGLLDGASSRTTIAAMAQAAAAAAGLPDPAAVEEEEHPLSPIQIDDTLGDGPALALAAAAAAAALASSEEAAAAQAVAAAAGDRDASASPMAPAAAGTLAVAVPAAAAQAPGSNSVDTMLVGQVLSVLQQQMQRLIALEERRSVDILRLNAKVG